MEMKNLSGKMLRSLVVGSSALLASIFLGSMPTFAATSPVLNVHMFPVVNGGLPQAVAGKPVTYIYQIWNTGDLPISNVNITDNKCSMVEYDAVNQDENANHLLDKGELWSYFCTVVPTAPVTNIVVVSGDVNGTIVSAVTSANLNVTGKVTNGGTGTSSGSGSNGGSTGGGSTGGASNGGTPGGLPNTGFGPTHELKANVPTSGVREASASLNVVPKKLEIPKLNVNAAVEVVGLTASGNMEAPANGSDVAWYAATLPGQNGNAVVAGHVDTATSANGVFARLDQLAAGDSVYIVNGSEQSLHFVVSHTASYAAGDAPVAEVFGDAETAHLNLVTCDGAWNSKAHQYSKRLVVYTDLVQD